MNQTTEAVIRLHAYDPTIVTTEEYEAIQKDLIVRGMCGDKQPGDRILFTLLQEHHSRYVECVEKNSGKIWEELRNEGRNR